MSKAEVEVTPVAVSPAFAEIPARMRSLLAVHQEASCFVCIGLLAFLAFQIVLSRIRAVSYNPAVFDPWHLAWVPVLAVFALGLAAFVSRRALRHCEARYAAMSDSEIVDHWFGRKRKNGDATAGVDAASPYAMLRNELTELVYGRQAMSGERIVAFAAAGFVAAALLDASYVLGDSAWGSLVWFLPLALLVIAGAYAKRKQGLIAKLAPNVTEHEMLAEFNRMPSARMVRWCCICGTLALMWFCSDVFTPHSPRAYPGGSVISEPM